MRSQLTPAPSPLSLYASTMAPKFHIPKLARTSGSAKKKPRGPIPHGSGSDSEADNTPLSAIAAANKAKPAEPAIVAHPAEEVPKGAPLGQVITAVLSDTEPIAPFVDLDGAAGLDLLQTPLAAPTRHHPARRPSRRHGAPQRGIW